MQTQIEQLDGLKRRLTIQVEWEPIYKKELQKINEIAKKANIAGFRPGKAPVKIIKQRYGDSIRHEVLTEIMQKSVEDAVEQEKLEFAGQPEFSFDDEQTKENEILVFHVNYEMYPQFEVNELEGESITHVTASVTDSDIDQTLTDLQKQHAEWQPVERAAEDGDMVVIDFTGFLDGEKFAGGEAKGHRLILGSNSMIPGFETSIIGMSKADVKMIDVTFPAEYHSEDLAGKAAQFEITVHDVSEPKLLPLDDDFAEKFDIKEGGLAKLRETMQQQLSTELTKTLRQKNNQSLFDLLLEKNTFDLPEVMVNNEQMHMKSQAESQFKQQYGVEQAPDMPLDEFRKGAERRVALSLIIKAIIKKHEIKVDEQKIDELFEERFGGMGDVSTLKAYFRSNQQFMDSMNFQALELQVIEKLLEKMQINEETQSFFHVMRGEEAD